MTIMTRTMFPELVNVPLILNSSIRSATDIPVRIYHPEPGHPLPVIVYLHGGGHVAGTLDDFDPVSRQLAMSTNHIVVVPEYRLAPEYPYPADIQDAADTVTRVYDILAEQNISFTEKLRCVGDSAGGAIAATLAHNSFSGVNVDKLVLIYPCTDYSMSLPAVELYGSGYMLEKEQISWYFEQYRGGGENVREMSPLYMEVPENYPPALVISASCCPLRDDSYAYVEKLQKSGISVLHHHYDDAIHAFLNLQNLMPGVCLRAYRDIADFLNG